MSVYNPVSMIHPPGFDGNSLDRRERLDNVFTALADAHRRQVVLYFESTDRSVASVADLVDHTVDSMPEALPRDRLQLRFHHCALPKLDELGVIEYDVQNREIRYRSSPVVTEVLAAVTES